MPKKLTRKLKTYQTSLGFYDQAVAAPSMKAALEAWGASSNLFHQGAAKEIDDPDIVAATMASPGVVLRRPVGSGGPFTESAALPTDLADGEAKRKPKPKSQPESKSKSKQRAAEGVTKQSRKIDDQDARKAAAAFEKEERRRDAERRKEEAALAKERDKQRARRDKAVAAAHAALDAARREHAAKAEAIEAERAVLDERAEAEQGRWDKQRKKLEEALRRART
ncbi:cell envelope biogenesis protein TolA [Bradyrhizobium barranii subsp. barranii]|uniref:Cell envelope biogenesis protein TolA n=1 Tax=Bradyrhizobium barranii subsp. barranii TaxID=2823807 RepID=A0A939RZV4_9BRAD|nr:cell envelope biogenesis protein TolA [Bradyrhizobium barranii]UEM17110.1 cell envelope biogenesis protein TolA [Bradyrhizobium barranii subsp. barranii]